MRILTALVLTAGAAFAGGGFWLTVHSAASPLGKQTPDAAVLVAAEGCATHIGIRLTGTAEGLVNGERRSVPLPIVSTSKSGVWAIKKPALDPGRWVLAISGGLPGFRAGTLVELYPDGSYKATRLSARELPTQVEATLRAKAD
jgi:hypothetical protein